MSENEVDENTCGTSVRYTRWTVVKASAPWHTLARLAACTVQTALGDVARRGAANGNT
jgi:hypothetical protein